MSPTSHKPVAFANAMANRVLIPFLRSGAGRRLGRRLTVVEYLGRRSGQHRELVTLYTLRGRTVQIRVGMTEDKTWWRNFAVTHPLSLRLAGQDFTATAHVERDAHQVNLVAELDVPAA